MAKTKQIAVRLEKRWYEKLKAHADKDGPGQFASWVRRALAEKAEKEGVHLKNEKT